MQDASAVLGKGNEILLSRRELCKSIGVVALSIPASCGLAMASKVPQAYGDSARDEAIEAAKSYLLNFCEVITDDSGREFTHTYTISSEEGLAQAAEYIVDNGIGAFENCLYGSLADMVAQEPLPTAILPSSTLYATMPGNGTHAIQGIGAGYIQFPSVGAVEYRLVLGYRATASGGVFTGINGTYAYPDYISPSATTTFIGGANNTSRPTHPPATRARTTKTGAPATCRMGCGCRAFRQPAAAHVQPSPTEHPGGH